MKTVGQFCTEASGQLNDQYVGREFTRWTRAQLATYLSYAIAEIAGFNPDEFTYTKEITLVPGSRQQLEPPDELISLDSNANGTGITQADIELTRAFSPYECCAGEVVLDAQGNPVYVVKSYSIDQKSANTFYVDPPVPEGMNPVVTGQVSSLGAGYNLDMWEEPVAVDNKYIPAIIDYMQARAYEIDMESPLSARNSQIHFQRFYQMLGIKYKAEAAQRAGNIGGVVGSGDPRARIA